MDRTRFYAKVDEYYSRHSQQKPFTDKECQSIISRLHEIQSDPKINKSRKDYHYLEKFEVVDAGNNVSKPTLRYLLHIGSRLPSILNTLPPVSDRATVGKTFEV